jgi:ribosomal protein S12 methylthiotransferase accessory factor
MTYAIILTDAYKTYRLDQDKVISPAETVRRFREKLKKTNLDILKETVRIDNGRLDIPVYFSVCGEDAMKIIGNKKQMGKGGNPEQAEASAVMELAERFSFFSFSKNQANFIKDSYQHIKSKALSFETIRKSVHDTSEDIKAAEAIFSDLPLRWTGAYNLTRKEEVMIPFDWFYAINAFNGPSAGNCAEEALLQGICEIVERHVSSLISRNKIKPPAINRSSISDPMVIELISKFDQAGIQLVITDFSLNMGIPSVGVLAYDPSTFPEKSEIVWTAGTTPDPLKALSRALTETAQLGGDFNTGSHYVASGLPKFKNLEEAAYIIATETVIDIHQMPNLSHDNMKIEIENCVAALSQKGMEVISINTTHPELDIPAFYTIIPGAHFRERAAGTSVGMFSAKLATENEEPTRALARIEKMKKFLPRKYYIHFYMGMCHYALGEASSALREFEEALNLRPVDEDIPTVYVYQAQVLKGMEEYHQAIRLLEEAERYDSDRTDIYNLMGFCYFKLKDHEQAIRCFKKVIALDPSSAIDYANIGSNYRDMGNKEQAIYYYQIALELDPSIEFAKESLLRLTTGT